MRKSTIRKAFTLVEILIVVVILGILAAIVVPQFTSATQDSQAGNIKSQIGTLQRQIELYQAKTNQYPVWSSQDSAGKFGWGVLVTGGYVKDAPVNPAVPSDRTDLQRRGVNNGAGSFGNETTGWVFNTDTNTLYASWFTDNPGSSANANYLKVISGTYASTAE